MLLERIKILLGISGNDEDALLEILISQAEDDAKAITKRDRLFGLDSVIERMVVYLYNRRGSEGLSKESYTGASYEYTEGYPQDIMDALGRYTLGVNATGRLVTY